MMSEDAERIKVGTMTAEQRLASLLAMPEVAVWGGVMVTPDLVRDVLRESGIDTSQSGIEMLRAGVSVAEIKARMKRGKNEQSRRNHARRPGAIG